MIGYLEGEVFYIQPGYLILNTNGVGYELTISLSLYEELAIASEKEREKPVGVWVHTLHKEEQFEFFGFLKKAERDFFRLLLKLPGLGPRISMNLISSISEEDFTLAIRKEDPKLLTRIPGIGPGKAERIIFEFRKKFPKLRNADAANLTRIKAKPISQEEEDAVLGLESLGYDLNLAANWVSDYIQTLEKDKKTLPPAGDIIRIILKTKVLKK
jgi:Holliday junction DNA helicase RuvA